MTRNNETKFILSEETLEYICFDDAVRKIYLDSIAKDDNLRPFLKDIEQDIENYKKTHVYDWELKRFIKRD